MSPSVFSCRRVAVAVALLVRRDEVGEGRLQRPKATLSRWNLKVTNQAAGPGDLARRDTCLFGRARRQQKGRQTGLRSSSAMGVPWCRGQGWAPTKPGRLLIRVFAVPRGGFGTKGEGVVRGPLDVSTKSNSAGSRLETRGKLGAGWQKKVAEGGFRVEGSLLVRRIGGACKCRAEVS